MATRALSLAGGSAEFLAVIPLSVDGDPLAGPEALVLLLGVDVEDSVERIAVPSCSEALSPSLPVISDTL